MEKKGSRSLQPSAKGQPSSDSKKQDGASGKVWPRNGRRREPPGSSLPAKGDASRKPLPQRTNRAHDNIKRPKPRGAYNTAPIDIRTETTGLDEHVEAELGSVFLPGSKKQSLNHLLNFVYATPPTRDGRERGFTNSNRSNRLILTKKHKYNKEHFLQANCQFVVNSYGDYKQYMNNADALVDWSLIEQVNVQVSDYPACPICLYPPAAAKITRCGHIYCWSCVLHYLSLSDKTWRKCPICYESVHKNDLKSVVSKHYKTLNVGDVITFKLMKRVKGSLVTYPASVAVIDSEIFHYSENDNYDFYSKLLVAKQSEILSIIDRERNELAGQLVENGDCPENCFIEEAQALLNQRREQILNRLVEEKVDHLNEVLTGLDICEASGSNLDISNTPQSKLHYFYQASDGQHIYLHAINARMLEHTYGSLEHGPENITGKILEKEGGSMTEELRKRLRYLQHLPMTCQFEVAEIQLGQPIVCKETLNFFDEQLEVRKKRRQRRAKEEKRREKKIADEENRMMGKFPAANIHLGSESQFPCFDSRIRTESECTQPSESSEIGTPPNSLNTEQEHAGPSFAKMLASAKKSGNVQWPSLKAAEPSPRLINVTGQKMVSKIFNIRRNRSDSEPEMEECDPVMPNTSLGDVIAQCLQKVEENDSGTATCGKKKKLKNRKKVLFTTTLAYTGK